MLNIGKLLSGDYAIPTPTGGRIHTCKDEDLVPTPQAEGRKQQADGRREESARKVLLAIQGGAETYKEMVFKTKLSLPTVKQRVATLVSTKKVKPVATLGRSIKRFAPVHAWEKE